MRLLEPDPRLRPCARAALEVGGGGDVGAALELKGGEGGGGGDGFGHRDKRIMTHELRCCVQTARMPALTITPQHPVFDSIVPYPYRNQQQQKQEQQQQQQQQQVKPEPSSPARAPLPGPYDSPRKRFGM